MTTAAASDPFESTANPASYVPRPASERALEAVELALVQAHGPVAITGPAGLGKSMLLSVLGERLASRYHVARLPYPALSGADLCRWVLESLGEPASGLGDDPEGALLDHAFRGSAAGREILLLVDDASSLPPRTARSLATLVSVSGGAIRAVLAAVDDAQLGAALAALGAGVREVRFDEPMNVEETTAYVRARIAAAGGRGERFDADTLARIYGATGGIPRCVHELGSAIWRSEGDEDLPALIERWVRDDEGRAGELPLETIEIDADEAPALVVGVDEPSAPEPVEEDEAPLPSAPEPVEEDEAPLPSAPEPIEEDEAPLPSAPEAVEEDEAPLPSAPEAVEEDEAPLPSAPEPIEEDEAPPPSPPAPRPVAERSSAEPDGRRSRGVWFALLALALLVIAMPYALSELERRVDERLPEETNAPLAPEPVADPVVREPEPSAFDPEAPEPVTPEAPFAPEAPVAPEMSGEEPVAGIAEPALPPTFVPGPDPSAAPEPSAPEEPEAVSPPAPPAPAEPEAAPAPESPFVVPAPFQEPQANRAPPADPEPTPAPAAAPEAEAAPTALPEPVAPQMRAPEPAPSPEVADAQAPQELGAETDAPVPLPAEAEPEAEAEAAVEAGTPAAPPPRRRRPRGVEVRVAANPPALIYVDGGRVGETPFAPLDLSPGLHVFRAEFASGRAMVRAVEISAKNRSVYFEPSPEVEAPQAEPEAPVAPEAAIVEPAGVE